MGKKKLSLDALEVKSFTTNDTNTVKGGTSVPQSIVCDLETIVFTDCRGAGICEIYPD